MSALICFLLREKFEKISLKALTFVSNSVIILMYSVDGIDCIAAFQRKSGRCELLRKVQVLPLSFFGKPGRISALKKSEGKAFAFSNLGGTTRAFVPFGGGAFLYC